jgi:hypothetical protein
VAAACENYSHHGQRPFIWGIADDALSSLRGGQNMSAVVTTLKMSRRQLLGAVGSSALLAALPRSSRAQELVLAGSAPDFPWAELVTTARGFVDHESPDSVWPFEHASSTALANSERTVFCPYFTPFPLS